MTRAVVICPGRGTYNKTELGSLSRLNADKANLFAGFDLQRIKAGQETLADLDGANKYALNRHARGDNASALIYAASYADFLSLQDIEVVAVTGNSMGWYTTLACSGAVSPDRGFNLVNTMGQLMQDSMIGGQLVYPIVDDDWHPSPSKRNAVMALVAQIDGADTCTLGLSIDLGGLLVLAGNQAGLDAFIAKATPVDRFPMRLANHAGFHTALQQPVSKKALATFDAGMLTQPTLPMIDGRGAIWWPHATDLAALFDYTLRHQVVEPFDFCRAVTVAAREFAPDLFIVLGPGATLGGAVAQSLINSNWRGMDTKEAFQTLQSAEPFLVSMGRDDQRSFVTR